MERVKCNGYGIDVLRRTLLQPAAQQLERVQCDEDGMGVSRCNILQPAAPRSLVDSLKILFFLFAFYTFSSLRAVKDYLAGGDRKNKIL